jgi:hypothetical protein
MSSSLSGLLFSVRRSLRADLAAKAATAANCLAAAGGTHASPETALAFLLYLADTMVFHSISPANIGFSGDGEPSGFLNSLPGSDYRPLSRAQHYTDNRLHFKGNLPRLNNA